MARTKSKTGKARALNTLQVTGWVACAAGVALLLLPLLTGTSSAMAALAAVLSNLGWLALALGIILLVLHRFIKPSPSAFASPSASEDSVQKPSIFGNLSRRPAKVTTVSKSQSEQESAAGSRHAGASAASGMAPSPPLPAGWSAEVFAAIEWRRFEVVCEALFAQAGLEAESQSHGADGGVDIWLYSHNAEGPVAVVQCKHWQSKAVGVKEMREFFGVMASNQLKRGTYATTSSYTHGAQQFARANGINALDVADLLKLIADRSPEEQQALLRVAFDGDYWRPTCANCGVKMVERTPSNGGARFWGCSDYPRCKLRLPMVANLQKLSLLME